MISLTILATLLSFGSAALPAEDPHSQRLREKYPHGLLGSDFGLLTEEDLKLNTCDAFPEPLSPDSISYPYWQCFRTRDVAFNCESGAADSSGRPQALLVLAVHGDPKQEYLARHPMERSGCLAMQREWVRLTKGQVHVCVSGPLIEMKALDSVTESPRQWVFDRYKTKKGCVSYFTDECDLKSYERRHGKC